MAQWYDPERPLTIRYKPKPFVAMGTNMIRQSVCLPLPKEGDRYQAEHSDWVNERAVWRALTPSLSRNQDKRGIIDQRGAILFQMLRLLHPWVRDRYHSLYQKAKPVDESVVLPVREYAQHELRRIGWVYSLECNTFPWPANVLLRLTHHMLSTLSLPGVYHLIDRLIKGADLDEKWGPAFLSALVQGREPWAGEEMSVFWTEWGEWRAGHSAGVSREQEMRSMRTLMSRWKINQV